MADFFHFYAFDYDWYVFNIADVAVTMGAVTFIYDVLKPSEEFEAMRKTMISRPG